MPSTVVVESIEAASDITPSIAATGGGCEPSPLNEEALYKLRREDTPDTAAEARDVAALAAAGDKGVVAGAVVMGGEAADVMVERVATAEAAVAALAAAEAAPPLKESSAPARL